MDAATLAALAGNALVTAAVTDVWEDVRHKIARLFGRGQPDCQIERRLDATWEQLAATDPAELEGAQAIQAAQWTTRFGDLLADHPEADAELRVGGRDPGGNTGDCDRSFGGGWAGSERAS